MQYLSLFSLLAVAPDSGATAAHLNLLQSFVLGIVQGLTEFLPISSTAHLKVIPVAFGWGDPGVAFTAIIQLGSIFAVLSYFWQDLVRVLSGSWRSIQQSDYESLEFQMAAGIALGTLPIIVLGLLLKKLVPNLDESPLRSLTTIALASIGMALLLGLAEQLSQHKRSLQELRIPDGLWMGLAQALALIPGVSRSGSTLTAGLFLKLERSAAARFSFLLGIPAITLAGLVEFLDVARSGFAGMSPWVLLVGVLSATVSSYLAIVGLLRYLQNHSTWFFVWYRLAFGVAILTATLGHGLNRSPNG